MDPLVGLQDTQQAFNSRLAQREAQKNLRKRQKEQRRLEQVKSEEQSREFEKEQHARKGWRSDSSN
jgi:hypothetical protein